MLKRISGFIFITTTMLAFHANAQAQDQKVQLTDDWLDQELNSADFNTIDKLSDEAEIARQKRYRLLNLKPQKVNPWSPKPFQARLRAGAVITRVEDDLDFVLRKPIYVVAREQIEGGSRSFLYGKDNKVKYIVDTRMLVSVEEDLKLSPQIDPTIVYEKPDLTNSEEKKFPIEATFQISGETLDGTYFAQAFRGTETKASGERYEIRSYYNNDWPIQFGINGNAGRGTWNDEIIGTVSWVNVFIGPTLRWKFYQAEENSSSVHLSGQKSLYFESAKDPDRHSYSAINYQLDIDYSMKTSFGTWVVNGAYRLSSLSVNDSTEYLETDPSLKDMTSLSLGIGLRMDFDL